MLQLQALARTDLSMLHEWQSHSCCDAVQLPAVHMTTLIFDMTCQWWIFADQSAASGLALELPACTASRQGMLCSASACATFNESNILGKVGSGERSFGK